jgi:hypothetical protein
MRASQGSDAGLPSGSDIGPDENSKLEITAARSGQRGGASIHISAPHPIHMANSLARRTKMTSINTKLALAAIVALSMSTPVLAEQPDWSQPGDYYAPGQTTVQPATPRQLRHFQEGDYYAPGKTTVEQPSPQELNQFRDGDYYAPEKGE